MSGGAGPYRKGRVGERLVRAHLESLGWYVTRAYLSRGPWDLLALRPGDWALFVQVKVAERAYLLPSERHRLVAEARRAGAQAVVACAPAPYSVDFDGLVYARYVDMDRLVPYDPAGPI